jgi:glyoxylase-like metal-dependent hydrolase (beta-lactamase superfamily II)
MKYLSIAIFALLCTVTTQASAQDGVNELIHIHGDLYRIRYNNHFGALLDTPDGIVVVDTINNQTGKWLKGEIEERFGKPVRYLIYSHHHPDHISGAGYFSDTAIIVAHENAVAAIKIENVKEENIEKGYVVPLPDLTFSQDLEINLGGKNIILRHLGTAHTDNLVSVHFPSEKAVIMIDAGMIRRVAYKTFRVTNVRKLVKVLEEVDKYDNFEVALTGHGPVGTREELAIYGKYIGTLRSEVLAAHSAGRSLDEIKKIVKLEEFSYLDNYDEFFLTNLESAYDQVINNW